jgi:hypothetical protein
MRVVSGLGRPIDPSYASNRYAVAVTFAAGAVGAVASFISGEGPAESLGWGVVAGGSAFLSWAIGREIDPDRASTAALAAPLGAAAVAFGRPSLWSAAAVLLATRVLVRSTGVAPKPVDLTFVVLVAGAAAATSVAGFPIGVLVGAALVVDRLLPRPAPGATVAWGAAAVLSAVGAAAVWGSLDPSPGAFSNGALVVAALSGLGCFAAALPVRPTSVGDVTGKPLLGVRLRAARIAAGLAVVAAAAWAGGPGSVALAPAGAALFAVLVPRPGRAPAAT